MWGKLKFKVLRKLHIFRLFQTIFVQNIGKFSQKIFAIFGLKSSKLRRFFGIWKWTEDEDEDGSSDKNLRSFEDFRSFVATLIQKWVFMPIKLHHFSFPNYSKLLINITLLPCKIPFLLHLSTTLLFWYRLS